MAARMSSQVTRPPLTHFLCIPLITPNSRRQLKDSITNFKGRVSTDGRNVGQIAENRQDEPREHNGRAEIRIIDPKAIRPTGSLHLTLGVMSLDQSQLDAAINLLKSIDTAEMMRNVDTNLDPLKIDLKGLESMHEPHSTSILYIPPLDPTGRLYPFCLAAQKVFREHEFLVEEHRDLRLHATIINTKYVKDKKRGPNTGRATQHKSSPRRLDARDLLSEFKDYMWAENVILDRLAICEMGAKKQLDSTGQVIDEVYTEIASVELSAWSAS